MLIFNKRLLCKCNSVNEKNSITKKLKDENIEFKCVTKGVNFRHVEKIHDIFWFKIYVHKEDFSRAKHIIDILLE